jgi:hypothetical protein
MMLLHKIDHQRRTEVLAACPKLMLLLLLPIQSRPWKAAHLRVICVMLSASFSSYKSSN